MTERAVLSPRSRASRERVLEQLRELFLAEGFADLTIGDLADRLSCSRTTLYLVASSKEQIVAAAVRSFFKQATANVEERIEAVADPVERLATYLDAVAVELQPASEAFRRDVAAFAPARDVYRYNTVYAAERVRALIDEGIVAGSLRQVDGAFVAAAVGAVMGAIQSGAIASATRLDDAAAYRELSDLVLHGLTVRDP